MSTWKQRLLTNWHLMRIVRLGLGMMMLVMGWQSRDWAIGLFSIFFLYQAATDTGCCGSRGCAQGGRNYEGQTETVEYEEIK